VANATAEVPSRPVICEAALINLVSDFADQRYHANDRLQNIRKVNQLTPRRIRRQEQELGRHCRANTIEEMITHKVQSRLDCLRRRQNLPLQLAMSNDDL
jgi:hypothetical protein